MRQSAAHDAATSGVTIESSQTNCMKRPIGVGEHIEVIFEEGNPGDATLGCRVMRIHIVMRHNSDGRLLGH